MPTKTHRTEAAVSYFTFLPTLMEEQAQSPRLVLDSHNRAPIVAADRHDGRETPCADS